MDTLYTSSILTSVERQVTDRHWPAPPGERERVAWSPGHQQPQRHPLAVAYRATITSLVLVRSRLGRFATAS